MTGYPNDPVFDALNPMVATGELSAYQAGRVHAALAPLVRPHPAGDAVRGPDRPNLRIRPAAAVFGTGLALAGTLVAAALVSGDFDIGSFLVALALAAALLAGAATFWWVDRDGPGRRWTAALLGAGGVFAFVVAVLSPVHGSTATYLAAVLLIAAGVGGYLLTRGAVFTPLAAAGVVILFLQGYSDVGDENTVSFVGPGALLMVLGLLIGAVGWRFGCRTITGLIGAGIAFAAMTLVIYISGFAQAVTTAFGTGDGDVIDQPPLHDYGSDVQVAMVLTGLVALVVLAAYVVDGHVGYAVVAATGLVVNLGTGLALVSPDHPLRAVIVVGLIAVVVLAVTARPWDRRRPPAPMPFGPVPPRADA